VGCCTDPDNGSRLTHFDKGVSQVAIKDVVEEIIEASSSGMDEEAGIDFLKEIWKEEIEPLIGKLDRQAIFNNFKKKADGYTLGGIKTIAKLLKAKV